MINHPPPDVPANVVFLDVIVPDQFFSQDYMKYLPYMKYANDHVRLCNICICTFYIMQIAMNFIFFIFRAQDLKNITIIIASEA